MQKLIRLSKFHRFRERSLLITQSLANDDWEAANFYNNLIKKETDNNKCIIEHQHDINKPSIYSTTIINYAGCFRSMACKRCNSIEAQAKKIKNIEARFNYWADKNNWTTQEQKEFYFIRLSERGYLIN